MSAWEVNRCRSMLLVACLVVWPCQDVLADGPTQDANANEQDYQRDTVSSEARGLKLSLDGDESEVILIEQPVLRWRNAVRGGPGGGTFLWTAKGLTVGMCCIWWPSKNDVCLGFHSLTEKPIRAEKGGRTMWHSAKPGVEYHDVPDAPAAARSRATRLTQLRNMAREFSAALVLRDEKTEELRLLPQPLYRYPGDDSAIKDGAVFAFVTGTDPELILQIEAVSGEREALRWRYAITRRTGYALRLSHNDRVIWTCPASEGGFDEPWFIRPAR